MFFFSGIFSNKNHRNLSVKKHPRLPITYQTKWYSPKDLLSSTPSVPAQEVWLSPIGRRRPQGWEDPESCGKNDGATIPWFRP